LAAGGAPPQRELKVLSKAMSNYFGDLEDPRIERARKHLLIDIVVIALCAVIANADSWVEIELFANHRADWFKSFLRLPNGIPSHDTFARVFARIDPKAFQQAVGRWMLDICKMVEGAIIPIDGKTLRRSFDRQRGLAPLHLVSAWVANHSIMLGQVRTPDKSNEITAIKALLQLIDVRNHTVTIDAIGCQKDIAATILTKGGDYVLGLKGNQKNIFESVKREFDSVSVDTLTTQCGKPIVTVDGDHGRIDTRRYWLGGLTAIDEATAWPGLNHIGISETETEKNARVTVERRYYLVSFGNDVNRFASCARGHWSIENSLHWTLDVTFREDESRIRRDHAPENFAIMRRTALSLLKTAPAPKKGMSIKSKRFVASLDQQFLLNAMTHTATLPHR
jgi:predicted transposase YbfD/YdcC